MPQLITIARRAAIDVYRIINRRPQIDRTCDIGDSQAVLLEGSDFTADLEVASVREVLEDILGTSEVGLNPLQEDILNAIYHNAGSTTEEIAQRNGTTGNRVRFTKSRLLARLRKQAAERRGIAK